MSSEASATSKAGNKSLKNPYADKRDEALGRLKGALVQKDDQSSTKAENIKNEYRASVFQGRGVVV